jgi:hypothetical protein
MGVGVEYNVFYGVLFRGIYLTSNCDINLYLEYSDLFVSWKGRR